MHLYCMVKQMQDWSKIFSVFMPCVGGTSNLRYTYHLRLFSHRLPTSRLLGLARHGHPTVTASCCLADSRFHQSCQGRSRHLRRFCIFQFGGILAPSNPNNPPLNHCYLKWMDSLNLKRSLDSSWFSCVVGFWFTTLLPFSCKYYARVKIFKHLKTWLNHPHHRMRQTTFSGTQRPLSSQLFVFLSSAFYL